MEHLELAYSQYGVTEVKGEVDNPKIVNYFTELGFDGEKLKDETAWCSAFMNWVAKMSGLPYSGKLNARSWLDVGTEVTEPKPGDVVVLWRESRNSWKGHVGMYINHDEKYVYILGGNQNNQVNIKPYPIDRVLKYKRLTQ